MSAQRKGKKPNLSKQRSYYLLSEVREKITQQNVRIRSNALADARLCFGWGIEDILDAILKLKPHHFHKSDPSEFKPPNILDIYKARGLKGENIYTHFYIDQETGYLVINSFKRI